MKTIVSILETYMEIKILNKPPYVEVNFLDNHLTEIQKELIYRIYLEDWQNTQKLSVINMESLAKKLVELTILEQYDKLYRCIIGFYMPIIASYLLSNSLVKDPPSFSIKMARKFSELPKEYKEYYLSLLDMNILEKMTDIFKVSYFREYVKYSDSFINAHFDDFILNCGAFYPISFQKPPFNILVDHIGEFSVKANMSNTESYLTKEECDTLELLEKLAQ